MSEIQVRYLKPADYTDWLILAKGYKDFYKTKTTDAEYEQTWQRLLKQHDVFGLGAFSDGNLAGIAHYLFHTTIWAPRFCYLQDLYTSPSARGQGVATSLITAVAKHAKTTDSDRLYWNTQESNHSARSLYEKVAKFNGFIRYDIHFKPDNDYS